MTIKELANIIRKYKEQQHQYQGSQPLATTDEVIARQLLQELMVVYETAYNERKQQWFQQNSNKKVFEPTLEEVKKDMKLEEWFYYFVNRICMTPNQLYHTALQIGDTEEEAIKERDKTSTDILMGYKDYLDFEKVLNIWTQGK